MSENEEVQVRELKVEPADPVSAGHKEEKSAAPAKGDAGAEYFGESAGDIIAEYTCQYREFNGKLYVGTKAICFRASIWRFEQCKLIIPYGEVTAILHDREKNDGIIVRTEKKNAEGNKDRVQYDFCALCDRDTVYNVVLTIYEKSDPAHFKTVTFQGGVSAAPAKGRGVSETGTKSTVRRSMLKRRSITTAIPTETEIEASEQDYLAACAAAAMADFSKSQRVLIKEMRDGKLSAAGTATAEKYGKEVPKDLGQAWIELRDSRDPPFNTVAYEKTALSCNLDEFFDKFLSDGAPHSTASFLQERQGDSELETSAWKLSEDDGFSLCRTIEYTHPVNAPMAPPSARATKEQCFRRFGDHGICLETQTVVKDIPMADCFFGEDQLLVEPSPDGGVAVTARFEVRFVKRTMFRKVITNSASSELKTVLKRYESFLKSAIGKEGPAVVTESREEGKEVVFEPLPKEEKALAKAPSVAPGKLYVIILACLVAFMVIVQLGMILQIHSMNASIMQLNENQSKLFEVMGELLKSTQNLQSCATKE